MKNSKYSNLSVLLIGEYPPPHAGIGVQTKHLHETFMAKGIKTGVISLSLKNTGISATFNKIRYLRGLINLIRYLYNLKRIKEHNIIHILSSSGLNFYIFTVPALIAAKLLSKKCIIHYHGGGAHDFFKKKPYLIIAIKHLTDLVVVPSGFLEKVFLNLNLSTIIVPNIIDLKKFEYQKRNTIKPHILSVRNFTPVYNIPCAIKAFKILHNKYPLAKLTIAGDGPSKKEIEALILELNLSESITLTGNIPNNTMKNLYQKSDILLNTSNIDNMPISILEAQATGLVVVTTNPGGIPYMIKDGESGLMSNINDHEKLGECLISVINNQQNSRNMIFEGQRYVKSMETGKVFLQWAKIYNNL